MYFSKNTSKKLFSCKLILILNIYNPKVIKWLTNTKPECTFLHQKFFACITYQKLKEFRKVSTEASKA